MMTTTAPCWSQAGSSNGTGATIGRTTLLRRSISGSQEPEQQTSASVTATMSAKAPTRALKTFSASATGSNARSQPHPRATTTAPHTQWRTTSSLRPGPAGSDGELMNDPCELNFLGYRLCWERPNASTNRQEQETTNNVRGYHEEGWSAHAAKRPTALRVCALAGRAICFV